MPFWRPFALLPLRLLQRVVKGVVRHSVFKVSPLPLPLFHRFGALLEELVAPRHFSTGFLQALLFQLVEHGFQILPHGEFFCSGAGQVALVGAEHAGHALLPHAEEFLRGVILMGIITEDLLHKVALATHSLVTKERIDGKVEEPWVA